MCIIAYPALRSSQFGRLSGLAPVYNRDWLSDIVDSCDILHHEVFNLTLLSMPTANLMSLSNNHEASLIMVK